MEKFAFKNVGKQEKIFNVRPPMETRNRLAGLQPTTKVACESTTKRKKRNLMYPSSMFNLLKCLKLKHVKEFFKSSSIHGLGYFTNGDIHRFERFFWILSVTLSLIGCCLLIKDSYKKWDRSPVIVTFSETMTSIRSIPFPAVTICPEIKSKKGIFDYTNILRKFKFEESPFHGLTKDEFEMLMVNLQLCDKYGTFKYFLRIEKEVASNETIFDLIKLMAPRMAESLIECRFKASIRLCSELFQEIITEDGLCFTFNTLTHEDMFYNGTNFEMKGQALLGDPGKWTMEDGYGEEVPGSQSTLYPSRVFTAGSRAALILRLAINETDLDYICSGPVQGFKVIVHSPNELPDVKGQYFRVSVDEDVRMSIKPHVMVTTKSLENYSPERRQCYFNAERKLNFLKAYTQRNCNFECIVNHTLDFCDCAPFSMPRHDDTPICGETKVMCYYGIEDFVSQREGISDFDVITPCKCLPACTSIAYDAEISNAKFEAHKFHEATGESNFPDGFKYAQLSIFFKENQFISSKRSELIGMTDFIAACGGLLGLFMGISLLSIVELVYYFSLRLFCSYRLRNTKIDYSEEDIAHEIKIEKKIKNNYEKPMESNFYW